MERRKLTRFTYAGAVSVAILMVAGCSESGGVASLGDGLPGCDSSDARQLVKSALMKHLDYSEGNMCFMQDAIGMEADPVGRAGFRPDPLGTSMSDCKVAPNGREFVSVRDLAFDLRDYLVEAESLAQDGRSVTCEISTAYDLRSQDQPRFSGSGGTKRLSIRYFRKTESGERRYEAHVYR